MDIHNVTSSSPPSSSSPGSNQVKIPSMVSPQGNGTSPSTAIPSIPSHPHQHHPSIPFFYHHPHSQAPHHLYFTPTSPLPYYFPSYQIPPIQQQQQQQQHNHHTSQSRISQNTSPILNFTLNQDSCSQNCESVSLQQRNHERNTSSGNASPISKCTQCEQWKLQFQQIISKQQENINTLGNMVNTLLCEITKLNSSINELKNSQILKTNENSVNENTNGTSNINVHGEGNLTTKDESIGMERKKTDSNEEKQNKSDSNDINSNYLFKREKSDRYNHFHGKSHSAFQGNMDLFDASNDSISYGSLPKIHYIAEKMSSSSSTSSSSSSSSSKYITDPENTHYSDRQKARESSSVVENNNRNNRNGTINDLLSHDGLSSGSLSLTSAAHLSLVSPKDHMGEIRSPGDVTMLNLDFSLRNPT